MKYTAKPVAVDAWPIAKISPHGRYTECLVLHYEDATGDAVKEVTVTATPEMLARIKPKVGDYYVVQSDGYAYLNPKEVFERKYSLPTTAAPATDALPELDRENPNFHFAVNLNPGAIQTRDTISVFGGLDPKWYEQPQNLLVAQYFEPACFQLSQAAYHRANPHGPHSGDCPFCTPALPIVEAQPKP